MARLETEAVDLLLSILEQPEPVISGVAAVDHYPFDVAALHTAGLLIGDGDEAVAADERDRPVTLDTSPAAGTLGYFDSDTGWSDVDSARLRRYRADMSAVMAAILSRVDPGRSAPRKELLPGLLWEWGDVRLGRRANLAPIWFGRHLSGPDVWRQLQEVTRARPAGVSPRIILTSTGAADLGPAPERHVLVDIRDVLGDGLAVDPKILGARLEPDATSHDEPISVSADGRIVRFYGQTFHFAKGDKQRQVVGYLHRRYLAGDSSVASAEIIADLDFGANTRIRDLFKGSPAWKTLLIERKGVCGFCFPAEGDR